MRRFVRRTWKAGLLAAIVYAGWRAYRARQVPVGDGAAWESAPFPFPPAPRPAGSGHVHVPVGVPPGGGPETEETAHEDPWMDPVDCACPLSHPVKAKLGSGIYHEPGGANYERTKPDRCYADAAAAEADGLRPAKR